MAGTLYITGDPQADGLLNTDGTALVLGMLLDQQVPMEWAFHGPATLRARLGHLDATSIAAMDRDELVAVCCQKPAIHRFPGSMGRRIHDVCAVLAAEYGGRAERIWDDVPDGAELLRRMRALPGYGDEKSRIFVAILAKTQGIAPPGWREAAGKFGDDTPRSVADIHGPESLAEVRAWKQ
nr:Fe-S cluster assembly protein HesB [Acidimicrobiia bacterium]